jgi:hypothetical protein
MAELDDVLKLLESAGEAPYLDERYDPTGLAFALSDTDFIGLALGAPSRVDLGAAPDPRIVVLRKTTGQRDWEVQFRVNGQLAAVHLETGAVFQSFAFGTTKRYDPRMMPKSMEGPAPDEVNAESESSDVYRLSILRLLGRPPLRGRFAVTFLDYELRSNTALVELVGGEDGGAPPEERSAARAREEAERVEALLARYGRPAPLDEPGLSFEVPARVDEGQEIPVTGTIHAELPTQATIYDLGDDAPQGGADHEADARPLRALLGGRLVILKRDEIYPPHLEVVAPLFLDEPPAPGDLVQAAFALELNDSLPESLAPGEYLLYVIASEHVAGPLPLEVVGR